MTSKHEIQDVMAAMPYGLYIVGSRGSDGLDGMMADWVMQVSFDPRMVAVSLENDARTLENIRATGGFSVNLLSEEEASMALAAKFAQPYYDEKVSGRGGTSTRVHHKLESVPHSVTASGVPILDRAMAWLECKAREFVPLGDHTLVVGDVRDAALLRDASPLTSTFTGWNYSG
jgi:flavin reductase (DIM6/NTAB) family NADH-FMN oxidoreductase RutF